MPLWAHSKLTYTAQMRGKVISPSEWRVPEQHTPAARHSMDTIRHEGAAGANALPPFYTSPIRQYAMFMMPLPRSLLYLISSLPSPAPLGGRSGRQSSIRFCECAYPDLFTCNWMFTEGSEVFPRGSQGKGFNQQHREPLTVVVNHCVENH